MMKEWFKFILMWIITIILLASSIAIEIKYGKSWITYILTASGCLLPYLYVKYKEYIFYSEN